MGQLDGRSALVTGGTSGIGLATAALFLEEGASVTVTGRDPERLERALGELTPLGRVQGVAGDVSKMVDASRMVATSIEAHGHLDTIFCNAGIPSSGGGILALSEEEWDEVLGVNLKGMYNVIKSAAPHMTERGTGAIVTMGSEAALSGNSEIPAYCAAKGGVVTFTKALALDLIRHGIRVNCLCAGITDTPLTEEEIQISADPDRVRQAFDDWAPIKRQAAPREQAQCVLFLVSERSSFLVGSVLVSDGGFLAAAGSRAISE